LQQQVLQWAGEPPIIIVDHRLAFIGFILGGTAVVLAILTAVIHEAKPGPGGVLKLELPPAASQ
jgi:hypothetical protein